MKQKHRTSNVEYRTPNYPHSNSFDVRSSMFDVRCLLAIALFLVFVARAAEVIPPVPDNHFNDYANVVLRTTAERLNNQLADFERETSNQILVAIFPKMESQSSLEDYTHRIFDRWRPGQKGKNNGAVLFVFVADRRMRIEVNYGLEGVLPDILCKRIIEDEIAPNFKAGNYDAGLTAGVAAMIQATRGEYQGTGKTVRETQGTDNTPPLLFWFFIGIAILVFLLPRRRGRYYTRRGWGSTGGWMDSGWGGSWGGGGGGWSGGGGDFSGGSFSSGGGEGGGGGGASGSW